MCFGSSKSADANGEKPARPAAPAGTHTSFIGKKKTAPMEKPVYHTKYVNKCCFVQAGLGLTDGRAGTEHEIPREEMDGMTRVA